MIRWLIRKWHARQRAVDIDVLWPACRDGTYDLEDAKAAFWLHTRMDPAWAELSVTEMEKILDELPTGKEATCL